MFKKIAVFSILVFAILSVSVIQAIDSARFAAPNAEDRPWVYWFWNNGNLTKKGITADLEAMQRVGIGGVLIMEVGLWCPRGPVDYMSDQWRDMFQFVVSESKRLGIEVNMNNGPGWNGSGGPWVEPEDAMKILTIRILQIGESRAAKIVFPPGVRTAGFYRDIVVLAFPTPKSDFGRGFLSPNNSRLNKPRNQYPAETVIPLDSVLDLTDQMNEAGEITGTIPPGNWTLIRFGETCKGVKTHPAPESGLGLECDKLSRKGIESAFAGQMTRLVAENKANVGTVLTSTHIDSWENGSQNWTAEMREEFQRRRKYDLVKFLPAFAGYILESPEHTDRFLWDFRRTVSELCIENYAKRMKELSEEHGLRFTCEAYGGTPCDWLEYGSHVDEPIGEFWTTKTDMLCCRGMASVGHLYGKRIIGAEAFTASEAERWLEYPGSMKRLGDYAFSEGINRFIFHRYAVQPWNTVRPGMMMGPFGVHYERTQTWWEQTTAYHEYLSRCQFMLRQGDFVADICYLEPEDSPQHLTDHPRLGYPWGMGSTHAVLQMSVENGRFVMPGGMSYRLLVLPPTNSMTPELLEKILELVRDGGTVFGNRPTEALGLTDYPNNNKRVERLAAELWGQGDLPPAGQRSFGKGKIYWGETPEAVLRQLAVPSDFEADEMLHFTHRRTDTADVYFVANPSDKALSVDMAFRTTGTPEFWNPETGKKTTAAVYRSQGETTRVWRTFTPAESVFVVFSRSSNPRDADPLTAIRSDENTVCDLDKPFRYLHVHSARYGIPDDPARIRDVTSFVRQLVKEGETSLAVVRMAEQGDPALDTVKTLTVDFSWGKHRFSVKGRDGETLYLNGKIPVVKVRKASYGPAEDPSQTIDVTEKLQKLFDLGHNDFPVGNLSYGNDPAPGIVKTLSFDYDMDGETFSWSGTDGQPIFIEPLETTDPPMVESSQGIDGRLSLDFRVPGQYELSFASGKKREIEIKNPEPWEILGAWEVEFPAKKVVFDQLLSWSDSPEDDIRYFSGTATYRKAFTVPSDFFGSDRRVRLELGQVDSIAELTVNGTNLGVLWAPSKSVDVTDVLKEGENVLEISITNLWPNRLIGDASIASDDDRDKKELLKTWPQWLLEGKSDPAGRNSFCLWNLWKKDEPLLSSGLIGPVKLVPLKRISIE